MEKVDEAIEQVSEPLDGDVIRVSRGLNDWLVRWAAGPVCQVAPATFEKHNRAFLNAQADLNANGVGVSRRSISRTATSRLTTVRIKQVWRTLSRGSSR